MVSQPGIEGNESFKFSSGEAMSFFYKIKVLKIEKNRKKMVLLIEAETRGLNTYIFIGQNLIQKFLVLENFRAF